MSHHKLTNLLQKAFNTKLCHRIPIRWQYNLYKRIEYYLTSADIEVRDFRIFPGYNVLIVRKEPLIFTLQRRDQLFSITICEPERNTRYSRALLVVKQGKLKSLKPTNGHRSFQKIKGIPQICQSGRKPEKFGTNDVARFIEKTLEKRLKSKSTYLLLDKLRKITGLEAFCGTNTKGVGISVEVLDSKFGFKDLELGFLFESYITESVIVETSFFKTDTKGEFFEVTYETADHERIARRELRKANKLLRKLREIEEGDGEGTIKAHNIKEPGKTESEIILEEIKSLKEKADNNKKSIEETLKTAEEITRQKLQKELEKAREEVEGLTERLTFTEQALEIESEIRRREREKEIEREAQISVELKKQRMLDVAKVREIARFVENRNPPKKTSVIAGKLARGENIKHDQSQYGTFVEASEPPTYMDKDLMKEIEKFRIEKEEIYNSLSVQELADALRVARKEVSKTWHIPVNDLEEGEILERSSFAPDVGDLLGEKDDFNFLDDEDNFSLNSSESEDEPEPIEEEKNPAMEESESEPEEDTRIVFISKGDEPEKKKSKFKEPLVPLHKPERQRHFNFPTLSSSEKKNYLDVKEALLKKKAGKRKPPDTFYI